MSPTPDRAKRCLILHTLSIHAPPLQGVWPAPLPLPAAVCGVGASLLGAEACAPPHGMPLLLCPSPFSFFFENLEKPRVATEYIHATPTLRPTYFHFAVYVEMSYSRYRSSVNETGIIGTQGSKSLCEVSAKDFFFFFFFEKLKN